MKKIRYLLPFPLFLLLSHLFRVFFPSLFIIPCLLYCIFLIPYSGGTAVSLRSRRQTTWSSIPGKSKGFFFLQNYHPVSVRGCFNRARVFGLDADHSSPYIAARKRAWCCISIPPYVSVGWALGLIRHRVKFFFSPVGFIRFSFSCCFSLSLSNIFSRFLCFFPVFLSSFFFLFLFFISLFGCWFSFLHLFLLVRWSVYFSGVTLFAFISSHSFLLSASSTF